MLTATPVPIQIPEPDLAVFCRKWQITELALFGSVLRDDFGPDSDVDVLARFAPDSRHTLFDMVDMQNELELIVQRPVDLLDRVSVEECENYIRRRSILANTLVVYRDG